MVRSFSDGWVKSPPAAQAAPSSVRRRPAPHAGGPARACDAACRLRGRAPAQRRGQAIAVVHIAGDGLRLVAQIALRTRVVGIAAHLDDAPACAVAADAELDAAVDVAEVAGRLVPGEGWGGRRGGAGVHGVSRYRAAGVHAGGWTSQFKMTNLILENDERHRSGCRV